MSTASAERLQSHLEAPLGRGHEPASAHTGAAGGAACGDLIRVSLTLDPASPEGTVADGGFDASGCGAVIAAGSAVVALVRGAPLLHAARVGAREIAAELGGLSPAKRHAAELAADALHRALGAAARTQASLAPVAGRTLVAMSGGVDSAVAALLVAERGEAVAVTLELWSDPENDGDLSCCSAQAVRGARELAHGLGLAHLSIDLRAEFRAGVVEGWLADHAAGLTPNPCVRCNGNVRLDAMLALADRLGAATLATGHYARVVENPPPKTSPTQSAPAETSPAETSPAETSPTQSAPAESAPAETSPIQSAPAESASTRSSPTTNQPTPILRTAADPAKDQSYVLAALSPASLARIRFPLGELTKPEVRERAAAAGLAVARRRDSQDLCFLAGTRHGAFLERHGGLGRRPGAIVDRDGKALGEHAGAHAYTVGQRHGLGLALGEPVYVLATDTRANTVTVGPRAGLLAHNIEVGELVLHRDAHEVDGVRVRAHGRRFPCRLRDDLPAGSHARAGVLLAEPVERTAPGQLACLYAGELVVGHGTIA